MRAALAFATAAALWLPCFGARADLTPTLVLTKEPEAFVKQWIESREPDSLPQSASAVRPGESIAAIVLLRGCASPCRMFVDYELVTPDGSIKHSVVDKDGGAEANRWQPLHQLSHSVVRFTLAPGDPRGTYTIRASIREPARGGSLRVSKRFRLQ